MTIEKFQPAKYAQSILQSKTLIYKPNDGLYEYLHDKGYWKQVEEYIETNTDAEFSHGLCESCADKLYGKEEWYIKKMKKKKDAAGS